MKGSLRWHVVFWPLLILYNLSRSESGDSWLAVGLVGVCCGLIAGAVENGE